MREQYGLTSQLRRSCSSVPANIAEGCGRTTPADFSRFLQIAMGSASETQYHLELARDLGFLDQSTHEMLSAEVVAVKRMLAAFIVKAAYSSFGHAGTPAEDRQARTHRRGMNERIRLTIQAGHF